MAGMNGVVVVGSSPAGRRLLAAGLAFQRSQEAPKLAPPPTEPEEDPLPPPPPLAGIERVKFEALAKRIQDALDCRTFEEPQPPLSLSTIIGTVAVAFGTGPKLLTGSSRRDVYVIPRRMAYLLCHELTGHSFPMIGRMFGGRDHSTIIAGIRSITARMEADATLAEKYADLRAALEGSA